MTIAMKAAVQRAYGAPEIVSIETVDRPEPKAGEVLVKIHAATVSSGDARLRAFDIPPPFRTIGRLIFGITKPRKPTLGFDFAGTIEALGAGVTRFKLGDAVFGSHGFASHAEYKCVPETKTILPMPKGLSFAEAAAIPFGGLTALNFWRVGGLKAGQKVLVIGASGAVGSCAVQLARQAGAEVTAVTSAGNGQLARDLGAGTVIDYAKEDFTAGAERYDIIFDTVGAVSFAKGRTALTPNGRFLAAVSGKGDMHTGLWARLVSTQRLIAGTYPGKRGDLETLATMIEAAQLVPVIDAVYPFDQIVAAHRRVDSRRKRGNVVLTMAS